MQDNQTNKPTFALVGLGFISDRHLQAIEDVCGKLIMACDIDESKAHKAGSAKFFKNWEDMLNDLLFEKVQYVSICTPNYLHFPMALKFAQAGKLVICEKPTVIAGKDIDTLLPYDDKINSVVQLRYNKELIYLRDNLPPGNLTAEFRVHIHRDSWYFDSWKADDSKSGGLLFNIGIHYFDLLCFFFGKPISYKLVHLDGKTSSGAVEFERCKTTWSLAINAPIDNQLRYFKINGDTINLTKNFERLHTRVYEEVLNGRGIKLNTMRTAIELVERLNQQRGVFIDSTSIVDGNPQIGNGTKIWHFCHIKDGAIIGKNVVVGQGCFIADGAVIGDNCKIQNFVSIFKGVVLEEGVFVGPSVTFTNVKNPRANQRVPIEEYSKTIVRKNASIGANSTILCGIEIGENAMIGAGSVVTKSVPRNATVVGNPAKILIRNNDGSVKLVSFEEYYTTYDRK